MATPTIFISYKRDHQASEDFLDLLEPALHQAGFRVLLDRYIDPGKPWPKELWQWLMDCDGAIALVSPDAATSDWCRREWSVLAARHSHAALKVIPVDLGGTSDILSTLQTVTADHEEVTATFEGLTGGPMTPADYLAAHNAWLRWQYRSAPVLGREPFSLSDVYVPTDCGVLRWGEMSDAVDPFKEDVGGRRPLLSTVLDLFEREDLVVVQGPAGSGKSAFTLHLADHLQEQGRTPVLVRFRDLRLSTYGSVDELLADAVRVAPIDEHPPVPEGPLFATPPDVLILDGWDEVTLTGSSGYQDQLSKWLPKLREYAIDAPGRRIRLLLTGRPSREVNHSGLLRRDTPVLTVRPLRPEHLRSFAGAISTHLDGADWSLDVEACKAAFTAYEKKGSKRADVLGSPLLALLAFRTMSAWSGTPAALFEHPTALYHALIETTVAHAGKAEEGPEGTVHRGGPSLRRLLQRVASVITTQGTEAVSFAELSARLEGDIALDQWTEQATSRDSLHELVVNFYFKGNPELGCEFLHKSFREYLHAESIVAALETVSEGKSGPLKPLDLDYWQDFPEGTPQHEASRKLAGLLAPQSLTGEVRSHLTWLLERAIAADKGRWTWIRDLLADVWAWWFEDVHLRTLPERRRGRTEWNEPYVVEMLRDAVPREERSDAIPPRITALDGHVGEVLLQLTAIVHAQVWSSDTAGDRPFQTTIDGIVRFRPGNGLAHTIAARIDAAGHNTGFPAFDRMTLPAVVFRNEALSFQRLSNGHFPGIDLGGADLLGADLSYSNLVSARLTNAILSRAYLSGVNLIGADLTGANLTEAYLAYTILDGAILTGADLDGADLDGADLGGADLTRANLTRASLGGAILTGADLTDADLTDSYLAGARLGRAVLPEGFDFSDLSRVRPL